jgi:uncharacterized protein (UPF0332 family)
MTCNPVSLFEAAKAVQAIANDEALFRAATNRAYYASYHCCREYNASLPVAPIQGNGVHEQLINQLTFPSQKLTQNGRLRASTIGRYLRALCNSRAQADYDITTPFDKDRMDSSLRIAQSIFAAVTVTKGLIEDNA